MLCIRSDPREHGFEGVCVLAPAAVRSLIEERFPVTRACFCNFRLALSNSFATVGMRYLDGIEGEIDEGLGLDRIEQCFGRAALALPSLALPALPVGESDTLHVLLELTRVALDLRLETLATRGIATSCAERRFT